MYSTSCIHTKKIGKLATRTKLSISVFSSEFSQCLLRFRITRRSAGASCTALIYKRSDSILVFQGSDGLSLEHWLRLWAYALQRSYAFEVLPMITFRPIDSNHINCNQLNRRDCLRGLQPLAQVTVKGDYNPSGRARGDLNL